MLFLDELAEFDRPTLDALRQPLEEGVLMIARAHGHVRYPARFQLVAAMNPCRCGYANDPDMQCRCSTGDPDRYVRRVSGPLIDRLDIQIEMARVPVAELLGGSAPEASASVLRAGAGVCGPVVVPPRGFEGTIQRTQPVCVVRGTVIDDTAPVTAYGSDLRTMTNPDLEAAWGEVLAALDALPGWFVGKPAYELHREVPVVDIRHGSVGRHQGWPSSSRVDGGRADRVAVRPEPGLLPA